MTTLQGFRIELRDSTGRAIYRSWDKSYPLFSGSLSIASRNMEDPIVIITFLQSGEYSFSVNWSYVK